eukprot:3532804-Rhodomonas_salina.1
MVEVMYMTKRGSTEGEFRFKILPSRHLEVSSGLGSVIVEKRSRGFGFDAPSRYFSQGVGAGPTSGHASNPPDGTTGTAAPVHGGCRELDGWTAFHMGTWLGTDHPQFRLGFVAMIPRSDPQCLRCLHGQSFGSTCVITHCSKESAPENAPTGNLTVCVNHPSTMSPSIIWTL